MNIALVKRDLLLSLMDLEFREAFKLENVYTSICFQIRALREQRETSQKELGRLVKPIMAQERISILEDPNADTRPTLTTLLRIADALDVGLDVRFVPFSKVLKRSVNTDMNQLRVQSFEDELPTLKRDIELELAQSIPARKSPTRVGTEGPAIKILPLDRVSSHSAPKETDTAQAKTLTDFMLPPPQTTEITDTLLQMQGQTGGRQDSYGAQSA